MEKNYTGQERNGIFDAWILNFDFGRKFLQRLFTFHYATMIISYKEENNVDTTAIMKLSYLGHTLKKWNDTSHGCESDRLNPISCICTHVERVN
jgi:hypothetical protein